MRLRPAEARDLVRLAEIYRKSCINRPDVEFREPCWQTDREETINGILSRLLDKVNDETTITVVAELGPGDSRAHSRNTSRAVAWMALRWESSDCVQNLRASGLQGGVSTARANLLKLVKVEKTWEAIFPRRFSSRSCHQSCNVCG